MKEKIMYPLGSSSDNYAHFHFHFQPLLLATLASFSFAHVVKSSSKMAKGDFNVASYNPHRY